MGLFIGTFQSSLRRAFRNIRLPLCILCTTALLCLGAGSTNAGLMPNVISVISLGGMSAASFVCICVVPIVPYGISFAEEWRNDASRYWMIRSSVKNYMISKVFATALSGFSVLFVSLLLASALLSVWMPISRTGAIGNAYSIFIDKGNPILYLVFYSLHLSFSAALFAVIGLWVSTYFPYVFYTITFPIMLYLFSLRFIPALGEEMNALWVNLADGFYDMGTPLRSLLLKFTMVTALCILLGIDTTRRVRKRVMHE